MALTVGQWRHLRVWRQQLGAGHGEASATDFNRHMVGALGELAVAKALGEYWGGGAADFGRQGDVADIEVRSSARGHLTVYPADPARRVLVLAIIHQGWVDIAGWIYAGEAADLGCNPPKQYLRAGSPAQLWVDRGRLRPFTPTPRQQRREA